MSRRDYDFVPDLAPVSESHHCPDHFRGLFAGRLTLATIYRRLRAIAKRRPGLGRVVLYTYSRTSSAPHARFRGCSAVELRDMLLRRLPGAKIKACNNAPRGGKIGDCLVLDLIDTLRRIEAATGLGGC